MQPGVAVDLKRLQYFLMVADYRSFSRASSVIGIAQPALGRQAQRLEDDCGVRLFYRHGRGVTLTPEGELFAERVRPLLRQLAEAADGLGAAEQPLSGAITLGLTPTVMSLIGLPLLQRIRAIAPGIRLNFLTGYSGYVHEWMVDGRLDIAILHDARRSQHIAVDPLAVARLFLVSHPDLAQQSGLPDGGDLPLRRLQGLPLALPSASHGLRRTIDQAAGKAKLDLDIQYELDTLALMKDVAMAGIAHTVLAMPAVASEVKAGRLSAVALAAPELATRLMITTSLNRPLTRAGKAVLGQIKPVLREAVAAAELPLHLTLL